MFVCFWLGLLSGSKLDLLQLLSIHRENVRLYDFNEIQYLTKKNLSIDVCFLVLFKGVVSSLDLVKIFWKQNHLLSNTNRTKKYWLAKTKYFTMLHLLESVYYWLNCFFFNPNKATLEIIYIVLKCYRYTHWVSK